MEIARGQHLGERLGAVRVRAAGVNRRSERLPQKLGAALLKAVRGPRTLQESGLVQALEETPQLALVNAGAAQQECVRHVAQRALPIEQHEHLGGAIRKHDRVDARIGWIAQHETSPTAVMDRKDFDRP